MESATTRASKVQRNFAPDAASAETVENGQGVSVPVLQREIKKLQAERDLALNQSREWQLKVASLKAELDKERGSYERAVALRGDQREKEIRRELMVEWGKSEAAWRERIRNERLLRLSYERILLNLGFAPNRIASELVKVARPQPLTTDPAEFRTVNILQVEQAFVSQPASKHKGLFAYTMDEIKAGMKPVEANTTTPPTQEEPTYSSGTGKRDLLKNLAMTTIS